ncbi:MAG: class II aldolase/adducin family protein [Planctomycetes bacterium]|nr:class II aldolase/adducin family protein [Planctomycetota bacterium]
MSIDPEHVEQFVRACRRIASAGLVRCSSGNLSWRAGDGLMLISASRSWLAAMNEEFVTTCRIADGARVDGPRPSVETVFHAGILRERPEVAVVLHFQTPFATTLACCRPAEVNYDVIPEIPVYIGPIGQVPYLPPGSPELAEAVIAVMRSHNLAIMANHGQVVAGTSYDDAIEKAVFFELACEIIVRGGPDVRPLAGDETERLRRIAKA